MRLYTVGQLSSSEKSDILSKHSSVYNGYKTMQPHISNEQPLYVQDFANDKEGITVNGSGEVSSYSNKIYMKESEYEMDEISLDKLEKGKKYKYKTPSFEDDIEFEDEIDYPKGEKHFSFKGDKGHGHLMGGKHIEDFLSDYDETDEGIYDVEDINPKNKFDYTDESEMDEGLEYEPMESAFSDELDEVTGPSPLYSDVDFGKYDFVSKGPDLDSDNDDDVYTFKSEGPNFAPHGVREEEMDEQYFEDQFEDDTEEWEDSDDDERESVFARLKRGAGDDEYVDFEEIDEDLRESFIKQKKKINEMYNRMNKYN
jgi:hypothetical protein